MTECHPVAATRLKKALKRGAKMIVADPRRIDLAEMADLHLPLRVGSDVALLLGMAHVIAREGLVDRDFIEKRTADYEAFVEHLDEFTPEWAESICGVPAADIEKAGLLYGGAERGAIYYTLGITEHICGVDNVQSLCNLALMTGNLGREGAGINPRTISRAQEMRAPSPPTIPASKRWTTPRTKLNSKSSTDAPWTQSAASPKCVP